MANGINDALVARRSIEIQRNNQMWHVMTEVGRTDANSPEYNWGRNANEDSIPNNETSYKAQLVVYSNDGKECRSNIIDIPVMIVTKEDKIRERLVDKTIDRYSLVLFKFDSPEAGALNDRIIKEFIVDDLRKGAQVKVTGYTDVVGLDDRNLKLSNDRSNTVVNAIKRQAKGGIIASLSGQGVGETAPLYSNDLPEGRFYNRTVQVVIETPTGSDAAEAP
jgi:outer membrane protein OmpA-like peptidoglycan-associated protein